MKKIWLPLLLSLPLLFIQCKGNKGTQTTTKTKGVNFEKTDKLSDVTDKAKDEGKLIFLDLYATWCAPCKMMDKDVFTDKQIGNLFNDNFINLKIDGEKGNGPNIVALYGVTVYPTLLFLDHNGRVVERKEGAAFHTELEKLANNAIVNRGSSN